MDAYTPAQIALVNNFLDESGYASLVEWMEDSDFEKKGDDWYHIEGHEVYPVDMVWIAMEACGFLDDKEW